MSQLDALKLLVGMLNAFAGVIAAAPVGEIPYGARLIALAVVAACGFGLLFVDRIGKAEGEPAPKRRTAAEKRVDGLVERVGAKDAEKALALFIASKSDAIPQR